MKIVWLVVIVALIITLIYFYFISSRSVFEYLHPEYYGIKYLEPVSNLDSIKSEKIILSLLAFNCDIEKLKYRVKYLVEGFGQYKIFIYGLDSTEPKTIEQLHTWEHEDEKNVFLVPAQKEKTRALSRTVRIGTIRNFVLEYVKRFFDDHEHELGKDWNFLVMDSDYKGPMSKIGLIDAVERLNQNPKIYGICASGTVDPIPLFGNSFLYDSFAYIDKNGDGRFFVSFHPHSFLEDYTPIISGFSGGVLYRFLDIFNIQYRPEPWKCEHKSFHQQLKQIYDDKYQEPCFMEMSKKWHIFVGNQPHVWF